MAVLVVLSVHDRWLGWTERDAWRKPLATHAMVGVILGLMYVFHMRELMSSELAGATVGPDGWLAGWMISSPRDLWSSFLGLQSLHLPDALRGRSALILLAAVLVSLTRPNRTAAVLALSGLAVAATASGIGLYPFGPSRHNAWLVVFTLPVLGCLPGELLRMERRRALSGLALIVAVTLAAPIESALTRGPPADRDRRTIATEERTLRWEALAPLVVEKLDPAGSPQRILMTEQTYNLLMPLCANERQDRLPSVDATLFRFRYGTREVIVARTWDWEMPLDLPTVLRTMAQALPPPPASPARRDGGEDLLLMVGDRPCSPAYPLYEIGVCSPTNRWPWAVTPTDVR